MDRSSGRPVLPVAALAVALAALAVSVFTLIMGRDTAPDYTQEQRDAAGATLCSAFATVRTGVATNTNREPPGGPDDIAGALAASANARMALFDGGQYLLARLDPATPEELAAQVRRFAGELMDIGAAATAGVPNSDPVQAARLDAAQDTAASISSLCG
ncbi:MAG: hypothetical protein SW019_22625 [Actinomycetota bacterium]|nr:hypothetical protein [Actinomycetota bacterium]